MNNKPAFIFLIIALLSLFLCTLLGLLATIDFISTSPVINWLPFQKLRPIHVSLAVAWIFASATGGIYYFIKGSSNLRYLHAALFALTGTGIIISYIAGIFGGREYWEFHPFFTIFILINWIIFGYNIFNNLILKKRKTPVYIWMWITGITFFFFTYLEANLWLVSYFNENIVRDITVQWKAYGSLVGSWNMLVYGIALYLMEKISGDRKYSFSPLAFSLFFLGLINLMFGWAHHIYFVPAAKWIRITGYIISMTELILLARIIWLWRKSLSHSKKHFHIISFKFLTAADAWILINLIVALAISVPAINLYTHGTLITAAHAMGSTIGINTMILLASVIYIINRNEPKELIYKQKIIKAGYYLVNFSLFVFFISLLIAGLIKGMMTYSDIKYTNGAVITAIKPYYISFIVAGAGVVTGLGLISIPCIGILIKCMFKKKEILIVPETNMKSIEKEEAVLSDELLN